MNTATKTSLKTVMALFLALSGYSFNGCGTIAGNPTKPGTDGGGTSKFVSDTTLTSNIVNSHIDDAIDAIGEESAAATTSALNLGTRNIEGELNVAQSDYAKACETKGQSVTSTRTLSGTRSDTYTRLGRQFTRSREGTDSYKISWTKSGSSLKCSSADPKVSSIDFSQASDLIQESALERNLTITLTNDTSGVVVRKRKIKVSGSRKFIWSSVSTSSGVTSAQRLATWEVSKEDEVAAKNGDSTSNKSTAKVESGQPILTDITWVSGGPSNWRDRTIKSGTIVNDHDDGSRVTLSFDTVKFTKATGCAPQSGKISGKLFNSSADSAASLTFNITFDSGSGSIVWSNGDTAAYSSSGCSLDE